MKAKKLINFLLILAINISCHNQSEQKKNADCLSANKLLTDKDSSKNDQIKETLVGKIYFFAPELDSTNYTATGACDCCSSNVLFLTDSSFVMIDYCEADSSFYKGQYRLDKNKLELNFDLLAINKNYNWAKETDTTGKLESAYSYRIDSIKPTIREYSRMEHRDAIIFKGKNEFGTIDKERNFHEFIKSMRNEGTLSKLGLK